MTTIKGQREGRGTCILVEGRLWGRSLQLLVDTGATINVLSIAWWSKNGRPGNPEKVGNRVAGADGRLMGIEGQVRGRLEIGPRTVDAEFLISDINTEGILGAGFLRDHGIIVDVGNERLLWGGTKEPHANCRVVSLRQAILGGGEEAIIDGALIGEWPEEAEGLLEPNPGIAEKGGFRVGRGLVRPIREYAPVRVYNPGPSPVVVFRDMTLGTLERVEEEHTEFCRNIQGEFPEGTVEEMVANTPPEARQGLIEVLRRHRKAFQLLPEERGRTAVVQHKINTGAAPPIRQQPRRLAPHRRETVGAEIEKMLAEGVIESGEGPWAAPVVLVKKKDGNVRFCVDYRKLNEITIKDAYPLPRIDDSLDTLAGACCFSTLDLASGYWQVEVAKEDREKTAFSTHQGLYQFRVMPFGLCNAPGTFERLMEITMRGLQWRTCLVYLDDIIVFVGIAHAKVGRSPRPDRVRRSPAQSIQMLLRPSGGAFSWGMW